MKEPKLPDTNLSATEILHRMRDCFNSKYGSCRCEPVNSNNDNSNIKISERNIPVKIYIPSREKAVFLILQHKKNGKNSISVRGNERADLDFAKELREDLYKACNMIPPEKPNDSVIATFEQYRDIVKYIEPFFKITYDGPYRDYLMTQFESLERELLTLSYYKKRDNLSVQTGSRKMLDHFADAFEYVTGRKTKERNDIERMCEIETSVFKDKIEKEMEFYFGEKVCDYVKLKNPALVSTMKEAIADKINKKTLGTTDYSPMVQTMCKCYESFIKTVIQELEPKQYKEQQDKHEGIIQLKEIFAFDIDEEYYTLRRSYIGRMKKTEREKLGKLSKPFIVERNSTSHGSDPDDHRVIDNYEEAYDIFCKVADSIKKSYEILENYITGRK